MQSFPERDYLKRRATQELAMTLHADCVEAEHVHNRFTGLYLKACVAAADRESAECVGCCLSPICDREIEAWLEGARDGVDAGAAATSGVVRG